MSSRGFTNDDDASDGGATAGANPNGVDANPSDGDASAGGANGHDDASALVPA